MRAYKFLIAILMFVVLFAFTYYVHISLFEIDVIFYSAVADGLIATLFLMPVLFTIKFFNIFTLFDKSLIVIIYLLSGYIFAISIPTVIDRSLSFYILEKLHQRGGSVKLSSISDIIKNEYIKEHRLADVRITEQKESGTIVIENGCVKLTELGKSIVGFSLFFRKNLLPRSRLIMGEYSDDLINPFKGSVSDVDYKCK
jgi:predicted membrane protein